MPETNPAYAESLKSTNELILGAAAQRGCELDADRLRRLLEFSEANNRFSSETRVVFEESGLKIKQPLLMGMGGEKPDLTSQLDFIPMVDEDSDVIVNPNPQRGSTTQITLMGIEAFQDFVLLADAGVVPKPERFFGTTNPTMARFAKRVGFKPTPKLADGVIASYDAVAERLFSPEVLEIQQKLASRQAAKEAGRLTISA